MSRYGVQRGEPAWWSTARVIERHAGALLAIAFFPPTWPLLALAVTSYGIRMFGIEGINHRYFSHRSYKAGRVAQFVLAIVATQAGQRGCLWWAAKHRDHHKYVETSRDPHSPKNGFFEAYVAWFRRPEHARCDLDSIPDFARYPELRWLNRHYAVPFYGGALLLVAAGHFGLLGAGINGLTALLWGFYVPCCLVLHSTSLINTVSHMPQVPGGYQRFATGDSSVNRPALAVLALGAGFHNNHHRYASAARAGFEWYEIDVSYGIIKVMQCLRIVSHVKGEIPRDVLDEGRRRTLPA